MLVTSSEYISQGVDLDAGSYILTFVGLVKRVNLFFTCPGPLKPLHLKFINKHTRITQPGTLNAKKTIRQDNYSSPVFVSCFPLLSFYSNILSVSGIAKSERLQYAMSDKGGFTLQANLGSNVILRIY